MKKRLLLILIFGVSFAPAVFANEDLRNDPYMQEQSARFVSTPGEMSPERAAFKCPAKSMFGESKVRIDAYQHQDRDNGRGVIRAISANQ